MTKTTLLQTAGAIIFLLLIIWAFENYWLPENLTHKFRKQQEDTLNEGYE